jgi:hypothetical protein
VEVKWESAQVYLHDLLSSIKTIREGVRGLADSEDEETEDLLGILGTITQNLLEIETQVDGLTMKPDPNMIYWVEHDPLQHRLTLQAPRLKSAVDGKNALAHQRERDLPRRR